MAKVEVGEEPRNVIGDSGANETIELFQERKARGIMKLPPNTVSLHSQWNPKTGSTSVIPTGKRGLAGLRARTTYEAATALLSISTKDPESSRPHKQNNSPE